MNWTHTPPRRSPVLKVTLRNCSPLLRDALTVIESSTSSVACPTLQPCATSGATARPTRKTQARNPTKNTCVLPASIRMFPSLFAPLPSNMFHDRHAPHDLQPNITLAIRLDVGLQGTAN